jgi:succinoglycan biosynthesis protein ExoO
MMARDNNPPLVSVIVPLCGDGSFIEAAVRSALRQTMPRLEVIVAVRDDDAGLAALAREDNRLRLFPVPDAESSASQRNRCLEIARGVWITTLGCDDLMHPNRLERLLMVAERETADIVCDNVLTFDEDDRDPPMLAVSGKFARTSTRMDVALFLGLLAPVGWSGGGRFVRPLMRLNLIRRSGLRYDPNARDNADFDLGLRLLLRGVRVWGCAEPTYFHRRVRGSKADPAPRGRRKMLWLRDGRMPAWLLDPSFVSASGKDSGAPHPGGWLTTPRLSVWDRTCVAVRQTSRAIAAIGRTSSAILRRVLVWRRAAEPGRRHVCIISRQRVVGRTNGSSAYLIGLASALSGRGMLVHLVCPSPATFGRLPAFVLRPEMAVFRSISIRGSLRLGRVIVATNPLVVLRAAGAVLGRLLLAAGLPAGRLTSPAPYAIRLPWCVEEFLYLAGHARAHADVILADYAFLTDGIPYVLRPDAPAAVVMHDLVSSRAAEYGPLGGDASVSTLGVGAEMKMLAQADAVVAIQAAEAAVVRRHLPRHEVIVAPLAVESLTVAQPGNGTDLLFVASKTTANIDGLRWFLDAVWPMVIEAAPDAVLLVAGGVGEMFPTVPTGIRVLGHVPDLAPLYATAAVIISPLRGGSGLKIKLVEAMAQGKAIVATTTTLQGVEDVVGPAVWVADDPAGFAAGIVTLLGDDDLRREYAEAALDVARCRFSAEACYAAFLDFMCGADGSRQATDPHLQTREVASVTGQ